MRKFTLLGAAALMAVSVSASPLKPINNHKASKLFSGQTEVASQRVAKIYESGNKMMESPAQALRKGGKAQKVKGTRQAPAPMESEIILEQPAGKLSNWSRDCMSWYGFMGFVGQEPIAGCVQQIVEGDDGKIYLNVLFSQFPLGDVWVYADKKEDGGFVIPGGQKVYTEEYDGQIMDCYLVPMTFAYDEEEEDYIFSYTESAAFNYVDGNYVQADSDVIIALCENDEYTEGEYEWTGYGDQDIKLSPMTSTLTVMPDSSETEKWAALTDDGGYFVNVLVSGSQMYIKGLVYNCPEGVLVAAIDGDEITIKGGQFVGMDDYFWTWSYVYGGEIEEVWNEEWEDFDIYANISGDLHFSYDAEAKKLVSKESIIICNNNPENLEDAIPSSYLEELTIVKQNRDPKAAPANPYNLEFRDEMEDWGTNSFLFYIPEVDVDGNLLEAKNLYYRIYVDGEIFTFYDDEYPGLPEDGVKMLNCEFTNFEDIYSSGLAKNVTLYFEGMDELGVQSVYLQPVDGADPVEVVSEIVSIDTSAVKGVEAVKTVSSEWFDMQG
ncbi:MAG: hypothetical protein K2H76_04590, partial [Muribaculaceae bacterium]|nr:hypothetical protein [Muribaculaceae bacterium]